MCVMESDLGGFEILCGNCGVLLCWEISIYEYVERKGFWDNWLCCMCNPNYLREYTRNKNEENN